MSIRCGWNAGWMRLQIRNKLADQIAEQQTTNSFRFVELWWSVVSSLLSICKIKTLRMEGFYFVGTNCLYRAM